MSQAQDHQPEHSSSRWVPAIRKPTRREVAAVVSGGSLGAVLGAASLHGPALALAVVPVLLVLFVSLAPWPHPSQSPAIQGSGKNHVSPSPRVSADGDSPANLLAYPPCSEE